MMKIIIAACLASLICGSAFADVPATSAEALRLATERQEIALLAAGLEITSLGTPSLNAIYPVDAEAQRRILGLITNHIVLGSFPHGASTYPLLDTSGVAHSMNDVQLQNVSTAIANFVSDVYQTAAEHMVGGSQSWPIATVNIP